MKKVRTIASSIGLGILAIAVLVACGTAGLESSETVASVDIEKIVNEAVLGEDLAEGEEISEELLPTDLESLDELETQTYGHHGHSHRVAICSYNDGRHRYSSHHQQGTWKRYYTSYRTARYLLSSHKYGHKYGQPGGVVPGQSGYEFDANCQPQAVEVVEVCRYKGYGKWKPIHTSSRGADLYTSYRYRGQQIHFLPGDAVPHKPGYVFNADCQPEPETPPPPPAPTCGDNTETITLSNDIFDPPITTQQEINALATANIIDGNLILAPTADLDLSPLDLLTEITGTFRLNDNDQQTKLTGFDCLTSIGGAFGVGSSSNNNMFENTVLTEISGFSKLASVGSLFISDNDVLQTISGFNALTTITTGDFDIRRNNVLTSIPNFDALTTANQRFNILDNDSLTSLPGFSNLATVSAIFAIQGNDVLDNISAFPALTSTGSFFIESNPLLTTIGTASMPGFNNLATVGGDFRINANTILPSIPAFPALTTINRGLSLASNNAITDIPGFNALTSIAQNNTAQVSIGLIIRFNTALAQITGFTAIDDANIGNIAPGIISITNNALNCTDPNPSDNNSITCQ